VTDEVRAGLRPMLEDLVGQNLARDPCRRRLLRPTTVVFVVPDAAVVVTLRVDPEGVTAHDGAAPGADLVIRADAEPLFRLPGVPLRLGLPDPAAPEGRRVLADLGRGRVRIPGMWRRLPTLRRLTMLLSAR
jgi:hypothetical protein